MQFQRVNRKDSEKVYVTVQNVEGATITTGYPVAYAVGASMDGVQAVIADGATEKPNFIGVADQDIANNDYGRVQISGYVVSALISNVGSSITINAGDPLVPGPKGFFSAAPTYANSGFRYISAGSDVPAAVSAAAYVSGLLRMI